MRKIFVEAQTRIGPVKADKRLGHAGYPARNIGDKFVLDLDHIVEGRLYAHLFRHGAIKPLKNMGEPTEHIIETASAPSDEVIIDVTDPIDEETVISVNSYTPDEGPVEYPIVEEAKPEYNYDTPIEELEILNESQVALLQKMGVDTVGGLVKITNADLIKIPGIGQSKIKSLRAIYDEAGESYA